MMFVTMCLFGNVGLSISIVMLNKMVYTYYGFPNITMTCLHFVFTSIGMFICKLAGVFQAKSLPILKMLPISLTFCGFVVLTNLSLQANTVGTYQIIKCMTMPVIMVLQAFFYSRTFSTPVRICVVCIRFILQCQSIRCICTHLFIYIYSGRQWCGTATIEWDSFKKHLTTVRIC